VTLKIVENNEGHVVRQFIKAFRENWRQGIPLGMISIIAAYCAYLNFEMFNKLEDNPTLFLIAGIIIIFVGLIHITFAFPLCARYKNSLWQTLNNAKEIAFKFYFRTIILWIVVAGLTVVFMFNEKMMFIGLLVGPVSIFLVVSAFAIRMFRCIEKDQSSM
jgi:uncharacterized membrane protein YesL